MATMTAKTTMPMMLTLDHVIDLCERHVRTAGMRVEKSQEMERT